MGRDDAAATLDERLREAASTGERRAVFVLGEPGIGKTRLVSEFARQAHDGGTFVLAGRCDDDLELPYQPFVEALDHLVEHAPAALIDAHLHEHGSRVARLVPALDRRSQAGAGPVGESERYLLFSAIEDLLLSATADGPVLLVLEDLHWADQTTVRLLRRLLTSPRTGAIMILGTCRSTELGEDHPMRALLADLHREPGAQRLQLEGLGAPEIATIVDAVLDDVDDASQLARRLRESTNGNPFFVSELLRNAAENAGAGADAEAALPVSIAETLAQRVRRLGRDVRRTLEAAAVIGGEFDAELLGEVVGRDDVPELIDEAAEGALVTEIRGTRFRFAHALVQRHLYAELGSARRTDLHRRVATALERRLAAGPVPPAVLARHAVAGAGADVGKPLRYAELAAREAQAKLAPDEAVRWFGVALALADRRPEPDAGERCDLLTRRGEAERLAGMPTFRETLLEAADAARALGDPDRLVAAALANSRGMQSETGIVDTERIATLEQALELVGDADSTERARLLATTAAELMYSGEWDRRVQLSDDALGIARRLQDPEALTTVLNLRYVTLLAPSMHAERLQNAEEAIIAARQLDDPLAEFYAYHWRAGAALEVGDLTGARTWMEQERAVATRLRQPTILWLARSNDANVALIEGRLPEAERLIQETFEIGQGTEPDALPCFLAQRTCYAYEAGVLTELIAPLEQAVDANPGIPGFRSTLALALCEAGRFDEARTVLAIDAATGFRDLAYDVTWLTVACVYAHVSARVGDVAVAHRLHALLLPYRELVAYPYFGAWGPVESFLGGLAITCGDLTAADAHLDAAAVVADRARAPRWTARIDGERARLAQARTAAA